MEISYKERAFANRVKESANGDLVLFDVGANRGFYTNFLLQTFGNNNKIHSFEASDRFAGVLHEKFDGNSSVNIINNAASDKETELEFYELEDSNNDVEGMSSINNREVFKKFKTIKKTVSCIVLDDYIKFNGIDKINLLKIDTEGHELNILRGLSTALENNVIDYIQFEFGDCIKEIGGHLNDILDLFAKFEYKVFSIDNGGKFHEITKENSEHYNNTSWENYFAINNNV